jgi:hypothetical protein
MKYFSITLEINKFIFILLLFAGLQLKGQETTISPFSRLSIGDFPEPTFAQNATMGHLSYALQSPFNINPYNPASYSRLFWTSFEATAVSKNYWLNTANQSQNANLTSFDHLALGFPVTQFWGMAFGLMPVSQVGYDYKTDHSFMSSDSTNVTYQNGFVGSGGLNRAFIGNGFSIKRKLFLGFNFSYYFGDMKYQETIEFTLSDNYSNSANLEKIESGDMYFDFGAQYRLNLGDKWLVDLGAVFTPLQGLKSNRSDFIFTYSKTSGRTRIIDTVSFTDNEAFSIVLPPKFGFGVLLNRGEKFRVGVDFDYTKWSMSNYNTYGGMDDTYSLKTGAEFTNPDEKYILRLGARYASMPLVINGSKSNEMSATAGIAFPFRSKDKLNYTVLNIGFEIGKRGKVTDGWLEEKFINLNVGLTLNNKWFIKRVYD